MARKGGWTRTGRRGRFRYLDARRNQIADERKIERIELATDPAGLARRLDLTVADGEAAGDRNRRRRPATVPLSPGLSGRTGAGEVRQAHSLCIEASRAAHGDER